MPDRRAAFFDRDGTLMVDVDHCDKPSKVQVYPGAAEGLARLRENGWLNVIITNQSGIGRGYYTMAEYEAVEAEVNLQLGHAITASYFCPDHPDTPTPRRKPGTGMVEEAVRDHDIDTARSWFVGDKDSDIECGKKAGCRTILVLTGKGEGFRDCGADFVVREITEAIHLIASHS